jgi:hypothetical protein
MVSGGMQRPNRGVIAFLTRLLRSRWSRLSQVAAAAVYVLLVITTPATASAATAAPFRFQPDHGPVGTEITISGTVTGSERASFATAAPSMWLEMHQRGGVLLLYARSGVVHIDAHGHLSATFQVPAVGSYVDGVPDNRAHAAVLGEFGLSFPCHACGLGSFRLTAVSALAPTGNPIQFLGLVGLSTLVCGLAVVHLTRRRRLDPIP